LDIRDGALDFLFNVYKRLLPSLGGYITNHGGNVNLSHVDVILAEVGAIEDYVFSMRHETEQRNKERIAQQKAQRKNQKGNPDAPPSNPIPQPKPKVLGRAARILEKNSATEHLALKKKGEIKIKASHMQKTEDNLAAALALKESLNKLAAGGADRKETMSPETRAASVADVTMKTEDVKEDQEDPSNILADNNDDSKVDGPEHVPSESSENTKKRKLDEVASEPGIGIVGDIKDEFDVDDDDDDDDDDDEDEDAPKLELPPDVCASSEIAAVFKEKVSKAQQQKLDEYANNIDDKVRLHETGWKDRYYTDKCKADNVEKGGGREHLFRSYVVGLVWVMKYYYDGCPSWKWYYPFHYAPFASDLKNIERFQKDVQSFEQSTPFNPVEQLMAVLPSDSSHAIPKASQWLMLDKESPIIDFYPEDVPVDPNGKAMPWLWVVLLPFIDEDRLLAAMYVLFTWTSTCDWLIDGSMNQFFNSF
jgi:5'-3' exoribonuclease 2